MTYERLTIHRGTAVIFIVFSTKAGLLSCAVLTYALLCFQQEFGNNVGRLTSC